MPAPTKTRTVRFEPIVKQSGKPKVHTLWVAPEKDAELRKAEKTQRVMTLTEPAHGRAWVGEVGFNTDRKTAHQYLIFPKTLRDFAGARVVGIKLDEIAEPPLVPAKPPRVAKSKPKPAPKPARKPEPARKPPPGLKAETLPVARPHPPREPKLSNTKAAAEDSPLARAVRAAMQDLEHGNSVAAYQKLEHALGEGK